MATSNKITHLNETKELIKQSLNTGFNSQITDSDTFRSYAQKINTIYDNWPKVSAEGTSLFLNQTKKGRMNIELKGNSYQTGITLPDGYTHIEYIELNGTQYIDTGYEPNSSSKIEADLQFTDVTTAQQRVFGNQNAETNGLCVAMYVNGSNPHRFAWACQNNAGNWTAFSLDADTNRHIFIMDIPNNKVQIDNNNMTITTTHNYKSSKTLLIGAYRSNADGTLADVKANAKIYSFRIYEGKYLEKDFVPCIDSNNIVGLYDLVNNVFYQNAGTGSFIAGDIVPNPNTEIPIYNTTGEQNIRIRGKNLFRETQNKKDITKQFKNIIYGDFNIIQGETYTLSLDTNDNDGRIYLNEDYFVHAMIPCDGTRKTYTTTAKKTGNYNNVILIKTRDDVSTAYNISNIMLEKKSTASSFEPYSETVYKINLGKNLFNPIYEVEKQYDANGNERTVAYYSLNNNIISSNKSNNTYGACFFNKIRLTAGIYAFSFNISQSDNTTTSARVRIRNFDKSSDIYADYLNILEGSFETIFILTQPTTIGLMVLPSHDSDGIVYLSNIQLEKNNFVSQYEPYKIPIELNGIEDYKDFIRKGIGKNLATNFSNLWYSGTNQNFYQSTNFRSCSAKVSPNTTYTISKKNVSNRFVVVESQYPINTTPTNHYIKVTIAESNSNRTKYTFTTTSETNYIFFGYYNGTTQSEIKLAEQEIMIEIGQEQTPYEPYGYKDKWYIKKAIGKVVLDGSADEDWRMLNLTFYLQGTSPQTIYALCSHFVNQGNTNWASSNPIYRGKFSLGNIANQIKFMPIDETINTLELWKTWIASNNLIVYYALSTSTYEEITDSELLSQLNALEGAKSYNNQTYISQADNILPFIIAADALKKND